MLPLSSLLNSIIVNYSSVYVVYVQLQYIDIRPDEFSKVNSTSISENLRHKKTLKAGVRVKSMSSLKGSFTWAFYSSQDHLT